MRAGAAAVVMVCVLAGCRGEHAMVRESGEAADSDVRTAYAPDSLAWLREGRPVVIDGVDWRPVGEPLALEGAALRRVGEFEGMVVYAREEDADAPRDMFFPLRDGTWQPLAPADSAAAGDTVRR